MVDRQRNVPVPQKYHKSSKRQVLQCDVPPVEQITACASSRSARSHPVVPVRASPAFKIASVPSSTRKSPTLVETASAIGRHPPFFTASTSGWSGPRHLRVALLLECTGCPSGPGNPLWMKLSRRAAALIAARTLLEPQMREVLADNLNTPLSRCRSEFFRHLQERTVFKNNAVPWKQVSQGTQ